MTPFPNGTAGPQRLRALLETANLVEDGKTP